MDQMTYLANKTKFKRKPILYWIAELNGKEVDRNNSIKLLRHKNPNKKTLFKAIRNGL